MPVTSVHRGRPRKGAVNTSQDRFWLGADQLAGLNRLCAGSFRGRPRCDGLLVVGSRNLLLPPTHCYSQGLIQSAAWTSSQSKRPQKFAISRVSFTRLSSSSRNRSIGLFTLSRAWISSASADASSDTVCVRSIVVRLMRALIASNAAVNASSCSKLKLPRMPITT